MVKIRKAKLFDCNEVHKLSQKRELLTAKKEPVPLSYFKEIINSRNTIFLVAEDKKEIVGFSNADVLPGKLAIWWLLSVKKECQNKGIGKEIAKEIEKRLKQKKVKYIIGYAPKFNKKTLSFHKKNGFHIDSEDLIEILKEI